MAAGVLARLALLIGEGGYADASAGALSQVQRTMGLAPLGFAQWLGVLDLTLAPPQELALVGDELGPLLEVVRSGYRPNLVVAVGKRDRGGRRRAVGGQGGCRRSGHRVRVPAAGVRTTGQRAERTRGAPGTLASPDIVEVVAEQMERGHGDPPPDAIGDACA